MYRACVNIHVPSIGLKACSPKFTKMAVGHLWRYTIDWEVFVAKIFCWLNFHMVLFLLLSNTVKRLYFAGYKFREGMAKFDFVKQFSRKLFEEFGAGPGSIVVALP